MQSTERPRVTAQKPVNNPPWSRLERRAAALHWQQRRWLPRSERSGLQTAGGEEIPLRWERRASLSFQQHLSAAGFTEPRIRWQNQNGWDAEQPEFGGWEVGEGPIAARRCGQFAYSRAEFSALEFSIDRGRRAARIAPHRPSVQRYISEE